MCDIKGALTYENKKLLCVIVTLAVAFTAIPAFAATIIAYAIDASVGVAGPAAYLK